MKRISRAIAGASERWASKQARQACDWLRGRLHDVSERLAKASETVASQALQIEGFEFEVAGLKRAVCNLNSEIVSERNNHELTRADLRVCQAENRAVWKMNERNMARIDRDTTILQREATEAQLAARVMMAESEGAEAYQED